MTTRILPLLAACLITLSACGGDSDDIATAAPTTDASAIDTSTSTIASATETTTAATDGSASDSTSDGQSPRVTISRSRYDQTELRVPAGTTVVFENTDPFAHTVTSADGSPVEFDSDKFGEGETFEFTFDEPGEYPYFCQVHPTMRAVVIVE